MLSDLFTSVVEVGHDDLGELAETGLVLGIDVHESNSRAGFLADDLSQDGLTLDDAVWHTHLSAKAWQMHDDLQKEVVDTN